jgi:hypothetical protein
VATVVELSEPYRNHLVPVLPPGLGVCAVCWTAVDPEFRLCFQCNAARNGFHQGLADVVVPIALAVKREQLAHELWHYKYDVDPSVRSRLTIRLGAVLWRFLGQHEKHIAEAVGTPEFSIVTTVPGTRQREDTHPLEDIVGAIVGQTRDRYEPLLALGQGALHRRTPSPPTDTVPREYWRAIQPSCWWMTHGRQAEMLSRRHSHCTQREPRR